MQPNFGVDFATCHNLINLEHFPTWTKCQKLYFNWEIFSNLLSLLFCVEALGLIHESHNPAHKLQRKEMKQKQCHVTLPVCFSRVILLLLAKSWAQITTPTTNNTHLWNIPLFFSPSLCHNSNSKFKSTHLISHSLFSSFCNSILLLLFQFSPFSNKNSIFTSKP
jgi:hypothetical protein